MAEAVVRVMKEFRQPLETRGKQRLFDEFQDELKVVLHSPEETKYVSMTEIPLNEKGDPLLCGKLQDCYLEICRELDVSPTREEGS